MDIKQFASVQQNSDVMLLALQGCNPRQISINLGISLGAVQAIAKEANTLLANGGGLSVKALGDTLRDMQAIKVGKEKVARATRNINPGEVKELRHQEYLAPEWENTCRSHDWRNYIGDRS